MLNDWLGQLEGDLLALPRSVYRNGVIRVRQSKTAAVVELPIGMVPRLVARLDAALERQAKAKVTRLGERREAEDKAKGEGEAKGKAAPPPLLVCETTGRARSEEHTSELQSLMRI